jgi:hypothetical protein
VHAAPETQAKPAWPLALAQAFLALAQGLLALPQGLLALAQGLLALAQRLLALTQGLLALPQGPPGPVRAAHGVHSKTTNRLKWGAALFS